MQAELVNEKDQAKIKLQMECDVNFKTKQSYNDIAIMKVICSITITNNLLYIH